MVLKTPGSLASSKVPQTQGLVPRPRKGVVSVAGENHVTNEMRVAVQTLLWDTVVGLVTGEFPDDQCFV